MILTLDVGNTNITAGIFEKENIVKTFRMAADIGIDVNKYTEMLKKSIGTFDISGAIIGSVVEELNDRLFIAVKNVCGIESKFVNNDSELPIEIKLENKLELGADRIANGVRAWELYKKAVIVIDFGTATTFDIVNSKGEFIGGIIAPGVNTQLNSLSCSTSKLPCVCACKSKCAIGNNTKDEILSGVIRGTAMMADGMIKECEKSLGEKAVIIGTGGLCDMVSEYMNTKFDGVYPNLTLEGLLSVYNLVSIE